ncbi:MAG TPA: hypothetical protein VFS97_02355 [Nitrososphaeraceae archaeon]|nr:hypothetical protein [Nitrososphaeraceae archaeon]
MARLRKYHARVVQVKNLIERFIQLMKQDRINETSINLHDANRRAEVCSIRYRAGEGG